MPQANVPFFLARIRQIRRSTFFPMVRITVPATKRKDIGQSPLAVTRYWAVQPHRSMLPVCQKLSLLRPATIPRRVS